MKPGRKRKPGQRYPKNNRLTRAAARAAQEDPMDTAIAARMRHTGMSRTGVLYREPTGEQPSGFPLGRLYKRGYISAPQYTAGNRFADVMWAYLVSKGHPRPTPPALDPDPDNRGASLNDGPVQYEAEARAYIEALQEIDRRAPGERSATAVVWDVCLREHSERLDQAGLGRLRDGLDAVDSVIRRRERYHKKEALK